MEFMYLEALDASNYDGGEREPTVKQILYRETALVQACELRRTMARLCVRDQIEMLKQVRSWGVITADTDLAPAGYTRRDHDGNWIA